MTAATIRSHARPPERRPATLRSSRGRIRYGLATVLVAALGVLTACSGDHGSTPAAESSAAMSDEQIMTIVRQYGQCMREHGIARFRDGTLDHGRLTRAGAPDGSFTEAAMQAATEACKSISDKLPASVTAPRPPPSAADLEKLAKFSDCVRKHGFPDWPDPDSRGAFKLTDPTVVKSDKFQAARTACKQYYDGPIDIDGGPKK
jgi:hypothetical protein